MSSRPLALPLLAVLGAVSLAACSSTVDTPTARDTASTSAGAALTVQAQIYPLAFIAETVGADLVEVEQIVPAGVSVHGYELAPGQVDELGHADLALVIGTLTAAVDDALEQSQPSAVLDVADVITPRSGGHSSTGEHGAQSADAAGIDPHMWLNPADMAPLVEAVADQLGDLDPTNAEVFATNAEALSARFEALDAEYRDGLGACARDTLVVTHPAFGYLTDEYGLTQVGVTGLDEETEPSPARIAEIGEITAAHDVTTILFTSTTSPETANVLAEELDLKTDSISTITSVPDGKDYFDLAEQNLVAFQGALGCS